MNVPRAMLEAQPYRKAIVDQNVEEVEVEVDDEEVNTADLELTESYGTVKERTNYALLQLYEQKGYDVFKQTCINMKGNNWFDKDEYGFFKGECAEVFLYVTIVEFIEKFKLPWKVYLSLVLPHKDGITGHTTEIDLVLVSEEMITVFEAKSYGGNKTIRDICTIQRKHGNKDIYSQNALHCESLIKQIADLNINDQRGMKSVLFSYAEGSIKDAREAKYKRLMPVVTENTILRYLTSLTKLENKYWKPEIYGKVFALSLELTMEDHMNYINRDK